MKTLFIFIVLMIAMASPAIAFDPENIQPNDFDKWGVAYISFVNDKIFAALANPDVTDKINHVLILSTMDGMILSYAYLKNEELRYFVYNGENYQIAPISDAEKKPLVDFLMVLKGKPI